jgi:hypothetical protein
MVKVTELATLFHEHAGTYLSECGFELLNDESEVRSPHLATVATYGSERRGLYLSASFDPLDGHSAHVRFGRRWRLNRPGPYRAQDVYVLSNHYAALARRIGFEFPPYYALTRGNQFLDDIERMLNDLKRTLPTILARATLNDFISIEVEQGGARKWAERSYGPSWSRLVEVEEFHGSGSQEGEFVVVDEH